MVLILCYFRQWQNDEIERIVYKIWFDKELSKSITQYDSELKKQVGFQKFTSDEWINTTNNAVNKVRSDNNSINKKTINNNIANNLKTLYNNNKSESGINENSRRIEQNDKRRVQELFELYERGQTNGTTNSKELLRNQEQKTIGERELKTGLIKYADEYAKTNLTEQETKLRNIINKLGGDVVFYEYGNENYYQGLANNKKFYIDTLGDANIENVFYHELTHFLRQNNNDIYMKEIQPIVNEIASDYDYQEVIFNYANSASEEFDVRNLNGNRQLELAEEVVADYVAGFYGDLETSYGLPIETIQKIRTSMDKILNQNSKIESNVLPTAQKQNTPSMAVIKNFQYINIYI